jgi:hypothetical protein
MENWDVPENLDPECLKLCVALNKLPGITTEGSCCGHGNYPYRIYFRANLSYWGINLLLRRIDKRYGAPGSWSVKMVETDLPEDPYCFILEGELNYRQQSEMLAQQLLNPSDCDRKWLMMLPSPPTGPASEVPGMASVIGRARLATVQPRVTHQGERSKWARRSPSLDLQGLPPRWRMDAAGLPLEEANCEVAAMEEYEAHLGKRVRVKTISGYRDDNNSYDFSCDDNVIVRVVDTPHMDIVRWMDDDHLDPVWNVEMVERGGLPEDLRSCWIYGSTQIPFGCPEPSDVIEIIEES